MRSFLKADGNPVIRYRSTVEGEGVFGQFVLSLAAEGQFKVEYVPFDPQSLPHAVQVVMADQGVPADDVTTACAIGTSLQLWDICIGRIAVTAQRLAVADFLSTLAFSDELLLVKTTHNDISLIRRFARVFSPFSTNLWLVIGAVVIIFALLMSWIEGLSETGDFNENQSLTERMLLSVYLAFLGVFSGGPAHNALSAPGRVLVLGFGWMLVIITAAYTANLASQLTKSSSIQSMSDLSELINQGARLCVIESANFSYRSAHPELDDYTVYVENYREAILQAERGKICQAAAAPLEEVQMLHFQRTACSISPAVRAALPLRKRLLSLPVSSAWRFPLKALAVRLADRDEFLKILGINQPQVRCSTSQATAELLVHDMAGVFLMMLAAALIALTMKCTANERRDRVAMRSFFPSKVEGEREIAVPRLESPTPFPRVNNQQVMGPPVSTPALNPVTPQLPCKDSSNRATSLEQVELSRGYSQLASVE